MALLAKLGAFVVVVVLLLIPVVRGCQQDRAAEEKERIQDKVRQFEWNLKQLNR